MYGDKKKLMNHFTIAITTCQEEKWIAKCIESCVSQSYENFEVILNDALSTDRTFDIAKEYEKKYRNFRAVQSDLRRPQVYNVLAITKMAQDRSIIVSIDGDDFLKHQDVLSRLNDIYNSGEIWLTYGSHETIATGCRADWTYEYPDWVVKKSAYRDHDWLATHLRTYRKELFLKIDEDDLKRDGGWMNTTGDQAFMLPMLEMAGSRHKYVDDILYVYNDLNMSNDSNTNREKQKEMERYIKAKRRYPRLESLYEYESA